MFIRPCTAIRKGRARELKRILEDLKNDESEEEGSDTSSASNSDSTRSSTETLARKSKKPKPKREYLKLDDWQVEEMLNFLKNDKESWRILDRGISPDNLQIHKQEVYERFCRYTNRLIPPKGKKLAKFSNWEQIRKKCYTWKADAKKRADDEKTTGKGRLKPLSEHEEELYDLFIGKRLPPRSKSPTVRAIAFYVLGLASSPMYQVQQVC